MEKLFDSYFIKAFSFISFFAFLFVSLSVVIAEVALKRRIVEYSDYEYICSIALATAFFSQAVKFICRQSDLKTGVFLCVVLALVATICFFVKGFLFKGKVKGRDKRYLLSLTDKLRQVADDSDKPSVNALKREVQFLSKSERYAEDFAKTEDVSNRLYELVKKYKIY